MQTRLLRFFLLASCSLFGRIALAQSPAPYPEIAFTDGNGTLNVMNADGSNVFNIYSGFGLGSPSWSPDGKHIAFSQIDPSNQTISIWTIDVIATSTSVTGTNAKKIMDGAADSKRYQFCSWSPNLSSNEIAVVTSYSSSVSSIFLVNADGTNAKKILSGFKHGYQCPTWNPGGTELAVLNADLTMGNVYPARKDNIQLINKSTGALDSVISVNGLRPFPSKLDWTRSGPDKILFRGTTAGSTSSILYSVNVSTTALPSVVYDYPSDYPLTGSWSPDNLKVVFSTSNTRSVKLLTLASNAVNTIYSDRSLQFLDWRRALPPQPELAVAPQNLDFGSLNAGDSLTQCVTVSNAGVGNLTFNPFGLSDPTNFSVTTVPAGSLGAGSTAQYCIKFKPTIAGPINGTLTIVSNGADSGTQTVTLKGVGLAPQIAVPSITLFRRTKTRLGDSLEQCFAVLNTGTGPLKIRSVQAQNANGMNYFISRSTAPSIPVGGSDTICVRFKPRYEGRIHDTLVIQSNSIGTPTVTMDLAGTGVLQHLTVTPSNISFDSVNIGESNCRTVTLFNPGTDTLTINSNYFAGSDPDFTFTGITDSTKYLLPEQSRTITICFAPVQYGTRVARLRIKTNIPRTFETLSRDTSGFDINITGIGVPSGVLSISNPGIDSVLISNEVCRFDTVHNTGSAPVTVTGFSNSDTTEFQLKGIVLPFTLQAGQQQVVQICSKPNAAGLRTGLLTLLGTTDGREKRSVVPLAVFGELVCDRTSPDILFTSSQIPAGLSDTATVTVTNCGNVPASYKASVGNGDYRVLGDPISPTVQPGMTTTYRVVFTPSVSGRIGDTLHISSSNIADALVPLGGTGMAATIAGVGIAPATSVNDTSAPFDVTLTNTGNVDWTSGMPSVTGPFHYVGAGSVTIPKGSAGTLRFTFRPTKEGTNTGSANFPNANPAEHPQFTLALSGQGISAGVSTTQNQNGFSLEQNYPNPFHLATQFAFHIPKESYVRIIVTDLTGRSVDELWNGKATAGDHNVTFKAHDLPSGTYYCELIAEGTHLIKTMILSK